MTLAKEVMGAVEGISPPALAEEWDNSGLQVGRADAAVSRVLVALTPLPEVFDEAREKGADFLLFHHPLIFGGLGSLDTSRYPGDLLARAMRDELTVYASHTSLDATPDSRNVSVALAGTLGLSGRLRVVAPAGALRKLVVFVPEEDVEAVAEALAGAGAGRIGDYTRCTFRSPGTGTFLPGDASNPHLGERGKLEYAPEVRLEAVVPAHLAARAVAAATEAHPYEEMAHDVYPVEGYPESCGYGRVGDLPEPLGARDLADYVSERLGAPARLVSDPEPERRIERLAVLGGSGGTFLKQAATSGAGAYVTGDLDYHDALLAESLGLVAVDAGHAPTELPALAPLAEHLAELVDVPVEVSRVRR
ncbi:Dinuclear metal center protein, YbgI/SA1388 family [Rubrobacter radiotolerans]|uniref:GTP cyclohydrolase 1 type 2 homolog n=1 Tax=Rubrobacter radiotolerans TaxID=42256 RepID=A0A023X0R7_RUBRA|nr:Nif3-like dinuclear metal center hexameric protein [Rubrobacter radiotolerans]AHY45816.1 Dinuclear metal center protein, YbgI/SA1388 family [Rubrobacter radiotolerans]MDX5893230.1 Nif3-like dinuclear metal center hexameric protein [Rubrobacter radiotolerans]SMC03324.1 dinuclear metal center protein, YbgI/SA1388 family [Rubrobacter radiotolerans DSM 5868]